MVRHGKNRFEQEKVGRPIADEIYKDIFGFDIDIVRDEHPYLDQELGVDVVIKLDNGLRLLGQEKFLSHEYSTFRSITVEHYQDWRTEEEGDWFRLACQFYLTGYLTEDENAFSPWMLADWTSMIIATDNGEIKWHDNKNKNGLARASFKYAIMDDLPDYCIIECSL